MLLHNYIEYHNNQKIRKIIQSIVREVLNESVTTHKDDIIKFIDSTIMDNIILLSNDDKEILLKVIKK